jgi:hypothetical protein
MQKLFIKNKRERKRIRKNGQVSKLLKQCVLRCPLEKNKMNKIAHVFSQLFLKFQTRDMFSRSIVELG